MKPESSWGMLHKMSISRNILIFYSSASLQSLYLWLGCPMFSSSSTFKQYNKIWWGGEGDKVYTGKEAEGAFSREPNNSDNNDVPLASTSSIRNSWKVQGPQRRKRHKRQWVLFFENSVFLYAHFDSFTIVWSFKKEYLATHMKNSWFLK